MGVLGIGSDGDGGSVPLVRPVRRRTRTGGVQTLSAKPLGWYHPNDGAAMDVPAGLTVVTWNAQGSQGLNIDAAALSEFTPHVVILQEVQRRQVGALRAAMHATDACGAGTRARG